MVRCDVSVALLAYDLLDRWHALQQRFQTRDVVALARGDFELDDGVKNLAAEFREERHFRVAVAALDEKRFDSLSG